MVIIWLGILVLFYSMSVFCVVEVGVLVVDSFDGTAEQKLAKVNQDSGGIFHFHFLNWILVLINWKKMVDERTLLQGGYPLQARYQH
jgi:hypothetical protein